MIDGPTFRLSDGWGEEPYNFARPDWQESAACRDHDPDVFYPGKGGPTGPAKAVCAVCPVKSACLDYALDGREIYGIWGGLSEQERRRIRRRRGRRAPGALADRIIALAETGASSSQIVAETGASKSYVHLLIGGREAS